MLALNGFSMSTSTAQMEFSTIRISFTLLLKSNASWSYLGGFETASKTIDA
jgi:hypothetical protein